MPGPKPLPTRLKVLRGTLQPCRANPDEPMPEALRRLPKAPARLSKHAQRYWRELGRRLVQQRVLTTLDLPAFEMLCDWLGRADEVREIMDSHPVAAQRYVLRSGQGGYYINPLFNVLMASRREALKLAAEFGITPSSRQKVKAIKDESNESLHEILGLS